MFDLLERIGWHYERLPRWVIRISYRSCSAFTGSAESWCSLAHAHERRFWTWVLGRDHCRKCYEYWHP